MFEQLAVIVYGVLTLIVAVVLASMQHSLNGMVLAFAACGITYLFQFMQVMRIGDRVQVALMLLAIVLTVASAAVSTFGF